MDGFVDLVRRLLVETGVPDGCIFRGKTNVELPGFFRPEKQWDLIVVSKQRLIAAVEFKSHVVSFGNNFNNRTEEALGNATDLNTAYREGAFRPSGRPWLGYLMLLEDSPESARPVKVRQPHFRVSKEFEGASYAARYEILLTRLVRERLYDAGCFVLSDRIHGKEGSYREPNAELNFQTFSASLLARAISHIRTGA